MNDPNSLKLFLNTGVLAAGLVWGLASAKASAMDSAVFDNPRDSGNAACMVLEDYSVEETAGGSRASAVIRNICSRSLDVEFCFMYARAVDSVDRRCFGGFVRPGGETRVQPFDAPTLVSGPAYRWRYLPQ